MSPPLFCIQSHHQHLSKFHIYVPVYYNGLYLSFQCMTKFTTNKKKKKEKNVTKLFQPLSVQNVVLWFSVVQSGFPAGILTKQIPSEKCSVVK